MADDPSQDVSRKILNKDIEDIDAEIQRELQLIDDLKASNDCSVNPTASETNEGLWSKTPLMETHCSSEVENAIAETFNRYLSRVNERVSGFSRELEECDELMRHIDSAQIIESRTTEYGDDDAENELPPDQFANRSDTKAVEEDQDFSQEKADDSFAPIKLSDISDKTPPTTENALAVLTDMDYFEKQLWFQLKQFDKEFEEKVTETESVAQAWRAEYAQIQKEAAQQRNRLAAKLLLADEKQKLVEKEEEKRLKAELDQLSVKSEAELETIQADLEKTIELAKREREEILSCQVQGRLIGESDTRRHVMATRLNALVRGFLARRRFGPELQQERNRREKKKEMRRMKELEEQRRQKEVARRKAEEEAKLKVLEEEKLARERAELSARIEREKAEKAERERLEKLEKERTRAAALEAERQAKLEVERLTKLESERLAKVEAERLAILEAEKEAERKEEEEKSRLAAERERLAKLELEESRLAELELEKAAAMEQESLRWFEEERLKRIEREKRAGLKTKAECSDVVSTEKVGSKVSEQSKEAKVQKFKPSETGPEVGTQPRPAPGREPEVEITSWHSGSQPGLQAAHAQSDKRRLRLTSDFAEEQQGLTTARTHTEISSELGKWPESDERPESLAEGSALTENRPQQSEALSESNVDFEKQNERTKSHKGSALHDTHRLDMQRKRQEWMKACIPWSKISSEAKLPRRRRAVTKKSTFRPYIGTSKPPAISAEQLISVSMATKLSHVTTLHLEDLSAFSTDPLSQCESLQVLLIRNCQLVAVDGLTGMPRLRIADLQCNNLTFVELDNCTSLFHLNLSNNKISVLHGIDGCNALRSLDFSRNKLVTLESLSDLPSLQSLNVSENNLISTAGLERVPTLQYLDLSSNHLREMAELQTLALLCFLDISRNSLSYAPLLSNCVLLQNLDASGNNLLDLETLISAWLPLLRELNLAENRLRQVQPLISSPLLEIIDLRGNQFIDCTDLEDLSSNCFLKTLYLEGNPVCAETQLQEALVRLLPCLETLDCAVVRDVSGVNAMELASDEHVHGCIEQRDTLRRLRNRYMQLAGRYSVPRTNSHKLQSLTNEMLECSAESYSHAVKYRYMHEYGTVLGTTPSLKRSADEHVTSAVSSYQAAGCDTRGHGHQDAAAMKIQALWRGHAVRREIRERMRRWLAACSIQSCWRGYMGRQRFLARLSRSKAKSRQAEAAATKIQAFWRGSLVRKRMARILGGDTADVPSDDDMTEFAGVDLSEFIGEPTLNLEGVWRPPDTPPHPRPVPSVDSIGFAASLIPASGTGRTEASQASTLGQLGTALASSVIASPTAGPGWMNTSSKVVPVRPKQAWNVPDVSLDPLDISRRTKLPDSDVVRVQSRTTTPSDRASSSLRSASIISEDTSHRRSALSKKEELLASEWGFKDQRTAEAMRQRAIKLKYKPEKKAKLSKLDPQQRLQLIRKVQEAAGLKPNVALKRTPEERKGYFCGTQELGTGAGVGGSTPVGSPAGEKVDTTQRTFEWLHTQVGDYPVTDSRINRQYHQQQRPGLQLPPISPEVVAGAGHNLVKGAMGHVAAIGGDEARDRVHHTVGNVVPERRHSFAERDEYTVRSYKQGVGDTGAKTSSAPVARDKGGTHFSRRAPDVQTSGGWGSGRRHIR